MSVFFCIAKTTDIDDGALQTMVINAQVILKLYCHLSPCACLIFTPLRNQNDLTEWNPKSGLNPGTCGQGRQVRQCLSIMCAAHSIHVCPLIFALTVIYIKDFIKCNHFYDHKCYILCICYPDRGEAALADCALPFKWVACLYLTQYVLIM